MGIPTATHELIPLRCVIAQFLKAEHVYGLRFWYYVMIATVGEMNALYVPAKPMMTIETAESEWGFGSLEFTY